jgi:hypothetical protein
MQLAHLFRQPQRIEGSTLIAIVLSLAMLAFMAAMLAFLVETIMAERGPR